jgi:Putative peptidoglycan binding domain
MKSQSLINRALCLALFLFAGSAAWAKPKDDKDHKKKGSSDARKPSAGPSRGPSGPAVTRRPSSGPTSKSKPQASGPSRTASRSPSRAAPGGPSRSMAKPGPSQSVRHAPSRVVVAPHRPTVVTGIRRPSVRPVLPLPLRVTPIYGGTAYSVQRALAERGFYYGAIDGLVGPMTRRAIASFQSRAGLAVTGEINASLLRALSL